jgi:transposase-like protein
VSPALISNVTEEMVEEVKIWQNRPLDTWRNLLKQKLRVELNKR